MVALCMEMSHMYQKLDPASKFLAQQVEPIRLLDLVTLLCMYQVYPLMFRDIF